MTGESQRHAERGDEITDLVSAYDYELPPDRIAQSPAERREEARLLVLDRTSGATAHRRVADLPRLLRPGDLLVVNDTRVLTARIELRRATGGRVRGLLLEPGVAGRARALLEGRGRLRVGERLKGPGGDVLLTSSHGEGIWTLEEEEPGALRALLEAGSMPLPPYVERAPSDPRRAEDRLRYQTLFARKPGAVAAPTAGLHLTHELLGRLEARGIGWASVTLHVGPGTFRPVRTELLSQHRMDAEAYEIPQATARAVAAARSAGGRVVAVGTTVVRAVESAWSGGGLRAGRGETSLFIRPPYEFQAVDALLTNFHLPRSTLLALVAAFAGRERVLSAYREALARRYRFYSYGDAMLIL